MRRRAHRDRARRSRRCTSAGAAAPARRSRRTRGRSRRRTARAPRSPAGRRQATPSPKARSAATAPPPRARRGGSTPGSPAARARANAHRHSRRAAAPDRRASPNSTPQARRRAWAAPSARPSAGRGTAGTIPRGSRRRTAHARTARLELCRPPLRSFASLPRATGLGARAFARMNARRAGDAIGDMRNQVRRRLGVVEIVAGNADHAEPRHQPPAAEVVRGGDRGDRRRIGVRPAPVEARLRRLARIALPPIAARQPPADLDLAPRSACPRPRA